MHCIQKQNSWRRDIPQANKKKKKQRNINRNERKARSDEHEYVFVFKTSIGQKKKPFFGFL